MKWAQGRSNVVDGLLERGVFFLDRARPQLEVGNGECFLDRWRAPWRSVERRGWCEQTTFTLSQSIACFDFECLR